MKTATIIEDPSYDTNPIATINRQALKHAGVFSVSILGGPGCGKTTLIDATIARLMPEVQVGVIACDLTSRRDADRILRRSEQVVQVTTGQGGASDADHIQEALGCLDLSRLDLLLIENVGTLALSAPPDVGADVTVTVFSVAGGDDKADKHPELVRAAEVSVLNKTDLLSVVPFDVYAFRTDVRRLNPGAKLFELSGLHGTGHSWVDWLRQRVRPQNSNGCCHWFG